MLVSYICTKVRMITGLLWRPCTSTSPDKFSYSEYLIAFFHLTLRF